ncbi:MAG TPA: porin, partial [Patescibacteria group bacterium]|nr:porin [Patescibacteria group bacterium]
AAALSPGEFTPTGDLTGTQSDNASIALMAKYTVGPAKIYGGYEHIRFSNPSDPLANGSTDVGGYILSSLSNTSYNKNKLLDVYWTGVKYAVTEQLDVTGAYYGYSQNSFATGVNNSCASTRSSGCSGNLNALSLVADYKFTKRFDVYGGAMLSQVQNGLASGYLHDHTIDPMVGARLTF